jgi:hypothetical protein
MYPNLSRLEKTEQGRCTADAIDHNGLNPADFRQDRGSIFGYSVCWIYSALMNSPKLGAKVFRSERA